MTTNAILLFGLLLALTMGTGAYLVFRRKMSLDRVGPVMFRIIGIASFGLGSVFLWDSYTFVQKAVSAAGTVIRFSPPPDNGPVVAFATAEGEPVEFTGLGSNPPRYKTGDQVEVLYWPSEPANARINAFAQLWIQFVIFYGIAVVFTGIALFSARLVDYSVAHPVSDEDRF
jgi:hypothetical protein